MSALSLKNKLLIFFLPLSLLFAGFVLKQSFHPVYFENLKRASVSCCEQMPETGSGEFDESVERAFFDNEEVPLPEEIALERLSEEEKKVLSAATHEEKWIDIDLSTQTLRAYEGSRVVYEFPISSGKWGRTPTGEFRVWIKLRYTLMHGGSQQLGTYYYLPNVPYTQYFYQGYGLHGTYWHNNFGHPMSHGCVNMRTSDAETLFYWTSPPIDSTQNTAYPSQEYPGTRVVIHGAAVWE